VDPQKKLAITTMLAPINVTREIKRLFGTIGFYRRYFKDFANKASLMCKLFF
jgi:hypothetical protein